MRPIRLIAALAIVMGTQGCYALEALGGRCTQEQLVVTWPITITRGTTTTSTLLTYTLTPSNVDQTQFNALRAALVDGSSTITNVTWTVPAFDTNGGYIAFAHATPFTVGESRPVSVAFQGGGWGAQTAGAGLPTAISLRADNFIATSATGTITALATAPLRLRIDVTTRNAAGETIRVTGDNGFAYQKVTKTCVD